MEYDAKRNLLLLPSVTGNSYSTVNLTVSNMPPRPWEPFPKVQTVSDNPLSFIQSPESVEYDQVADQYFITKGVNAGEQFGFISAFTPEGSVIQEDFGFCQSPHGMVVVGTTLYVAGAGQICRFNTGTFEDMGAIATGELGAFQLTSLEYDPATQTLWTITAPADSPEATSTLQVGAAESFGLVPPP
eukprot:951014-Prorocentrum_minimum.AAC.1